MSEWQPKAYRVRRDREIDGQPYARAGAVVYDCKGWDYGCANDDTRMLGVEHVSVTLNADGDYPFFTIAKADLEPIERPDALLPEPPEQGGGLDHE